jgi:hypothetical protein
MMMSNMSFGALPMMNGAIGYGNPQSPFYTDVNMGQNATARTGMANPYASSSAGLNGQVQTQASSTKTPSLRQQSQDAYTSVMNMLSSLQQRSGSGTSLNSPSSNLTSLGFGSGSNGSAVPTQTLNTGNFPQGNGQPVAFGSGSNGSAVPTSANNMNSFSQTAQNSYQGLMGTLSSLNAPQAQQQQQGQVYSSNPFQIGYDVNGNQLSATDSLNQTLGLATGGSISIPTATGSFGGNTSATANFGVPQQSGQMNSSGTLLNGVSFGGQGTSGLSGGTSSNLNSGSLNLATSGNVATMASNGSPSMGQSNGMMQHYVTPRTGNGTQSGGMGQTFHSSGRPLHIPNMGGGSVTANSPSTGGNCQHSGNATPQAGNQYWPPQQGTGHSNGLQTPQVGRPSGGESGAVATSSQEGNVPFSQIQSFNQRNGAGMPYEVRNEDTGFNYTTVQPQTQASSESMNSMGSTTMSSPWHQAWNSVKASARTGSQQVQTIATNMGGQMTQGLQTLGTGFQSFGSSLGNSMGSFFGGFSGGGGGFGGF